jgi:peptide/nickel transport system substrate-binding protein
MKRRDFLRGTTALAAGGAVAATIKAMPVWAESGENTLLTVSESGPNSFDIHAPGSNRGGYEVAWNCYDRLISWGTKTEADGTDRWDSTKFEPELAEDWDLRDTSVTFKLRKNAVFHDGTPVTASDVKWSLDRAVSIPGFPKSQMGLGSLEKTEQFVVVDDHTFRVDFLHPDKLTMPTLGVPVAVIFNSELAKKQSTAQDPWAIEWLKNNIAGSGAYMAASRRGDQEVVFTRDDNWKCGPVPKIGRVIWRVVPSASTRRALLERGDADITVDLPPKDVADMLQNNSLRVVGTPMDNSVQYIGMQVKMPPFDNPKVRQAISYAIPYQKIMDVALYDRARGLFGGPAKVTSPEWPQPGPYNTDITKAKQLLAEAGLPDGFETTLSFDLGAAVTNEPMCVLIQESLAQIGVKVTLDKVAGSNWRAAFQSKKLPFITNLFGAWLNYPDYYFRWAYHGQNALFDTSSYQNPEMDKLIDSARLENDPNKYRNEVVDFIQLAFQDMPMIPLYQPFQNVAMRKGVTGYRYWFHRQLDYRSLQKA